MQRDTGDRPFQDNFSSFKLKKLLQELFKGSHMAWIDHRDLRFSQVPQRSNDPKVFYRAQATEQLDALKNKFIKRKLDQLILSYLLERSSLLPQDRASVHNSVLLAK